MASERRKLLDLFERLDGGRQETLMAFAEFLSEAQPAAADAVPLAIERPADETVVMAIRRLARAYPMLERRRLVGDASRFLAQHALEGRDAKEVIDALELVFERHYRDTAGASGR